MYAISRSANLTIPIREGKVDYHPTTGVVLRTHPALAVQFQNAVDVPSWAREAVSQLPGWGRGMGHNEDPFTRCGVLDTDVEAERKNWDAEEKAYVEAALERASSNGVEYVICGAPKAVKPWPKYDEIKGADAAEQIAWQVDQIGIPIGDVRRYEQENANREEVFAALDRLQEQLNEDVVGVISA